MKKVIIVLLTVVFLTGLTGAVDAKVYNWKFHQHMVPMDSSMGSHPRLVEMIDKYTNGRVKLKIFAADSIVGTYELLDAVASGTVEMASSDPGWWTGTVPAGAVASGSFPMAYRDTHELTEIIWDYGLQDATRESYANVGVHLLTLIPNGSTGFGISTKDPVHNLEELKGKKIRAFGLFLPWLAKLGASPVNMSMAEIYSALSMGAIDGVLTSWSPTLSMKFYEVAPYAIVPWANKDGCQDLYVNMGVWKSLPDDLRTIVQLTVDKWSAWVARYHAPRYSAGHAEKLMKAGQKFIAFPEADQEEMFQAAQSIWDEYAEKNKAAAKNVQILKDYYKEIGVLK